MYYYIQGTLGSTRVITDSTGNVCFDADYYPYGRENDFVNNCPQNFKFTGKERDPESGLDNFGARYYSSAYGRFMSPDPGNAGASPGNPQSWNAYSYVSNNPETLTDPTGRDTYACLKGGKSCVRYDTEQGLIDALNGTGAWLQDGQIFETIGGKTVLVGMFQNLPGPYTERGGMQSANIVNGLFGGIAAGAVDATVNVLSSAVTDTAEGIASAGATAGEATASEVLQRASSVAGGYQELTVPNEDVARQAADEFLGPGARPISGTRPWEGGETKGWVSSDGQRVVRFGHTDVGGGGTHWNFVNKATGGNLHVYVR